MALHSIQLSIESFFEKSKYVRQRGLVGPKFILMWDGTIALGDSHARVLCHLRLYLATEVTSVLIHARQREGLRVLERYYKEHIVSSAA